MTERKCDYPIIVQRSAGRSTCPDKFNKDFRDKGNCARCPKVYHNQMALSPKDKGEMQAFQVTRDAVEGSSLMKLYDRGTITKRPF